MLGRDTLHCLREKENENQFVGQSVWRESEEKGVGFWKGLSDSVPASADDTL